MPRKNRQEEATPTIEGKKVKITDKLEFEVLADIRLPAIDLMAKKGAVVELTHSQAAFFVNSGQIKRKQA